MLPRSAPFVAQLPRTRHQRLIACALQLALRSRPQRPQPLPCCSPNVTKTGSPGPCRMGQPPPTPRTQLALNRAVRLPRRRLARRPARHVHAADRAAAHARLAAAAPAAEAEACNRGGRASRRRPVCRAARRAHNSSVVTPRFCFA